MPGPAGFGTFRLSTGETTAKAVAPVISTQPNSGALCIFCPFKSIWSLPRNRYQAQVMYFWLARLFVDVFPEVRKVFPEVRKVFPEVRKSVFIGWCLQCRSARRF